MSRTGYLRGCYAVFGTDIAHDGTRVAWNWRGVQLTAKSVPLSPTRRADLAYGSTALHERYAMSGTDVVHVPTRSG
eukprot:1183518-Rhodomonas_salina.1